MYYLLPYVNYIIPFLVIFLWEHFGRRFKFYRPSDLLNFIANQFISVFKNLGKAFAYISSFYDYISFEELYETLRDLIKPLWDLVTSPLWLIYGYLSTMHLYKHPVIIVIGSATILGLVAWLLSPYHEVIYQFLMNYSYYLLGLLLVTAVSVIYYMSKYRECAPKLHELKN